VLLATAAVTFVFLLAAIGVAVLASLAQLRQTGPTAQPAE
jgi:hypothetical protein